MRENTNQKNSKYGHFSRSEDLLKRYVSCEFHFKQSVNRRLRDSMFANQLFFDQFHTLSKGLLESQTEIQIEETLLRFHSFVRENGAR